jgi:DNA-binding transcriptional LysR family regulator
MKLESLKVLCDIAARRSFSRAAELNGISQSAASQVVGQLESRLGVQLIERSKRPLVLTPQGQLFVEGCRKLIARYEALEDEVRSLQSDAAGRVRVAAIYSVGLHGMSGYVQAFVSRHPRATVRLEYLHPERVLESVESGQADLGLVSYPRSTRSLVAQPWREERIVLVCSPQHALADRESIGLAELHRRPMVAFDPDLVIRQELDRVLAARGVEPLVAMEFDNVETIKRAVEIDAGFALLPEPTIGRELATGTLRGVRIDDETIVRPMGIIHARGIPLSATASRFVDLLCGRPCPVEASDPLAAPASPIAIVDPADPPAASQPAAGDPSGRSRRPRVARGLAACPP